LDYCRIQQSKLAGHIHHNGKRVVPIGNAHSHSYGNTERYTYTYTDTDAHAFFRGGRLQSREWGTRFELGGANRLSKPDADSQ
jgi:hypothetical protein